jgi:hypothetical protein
VSEWFSGDLRGVISCDDCGTLAVKHTARKSNKWRVYSRDRLHYQHICGPCVIEYADPNVLYQFDDWDEMTRLRLRGDQ